MIMKNTPVIHVRLSRPNHDWQVHQILMILKYLLKQVYLPRDLDAFRFAPHLSLALASISLGPQLMHVAV